MCRKLFLAPNGNGISRAECVDTNGDGNEHWDVQFLLEGQDVRCLAAHPQDANILYAGTQGEGVLRSEDGGKTWHACGLAGTIVKSMAVSSHDPRNIYAGTKPARIYRSADGGSTWQELTRFRRVPWRWWWFSPAETPFQAYVNAIAVSPIEPGVVLAGIEFGAVVRSEDGGITWSGHRRGALRDCHALKYHPTNGNWAYEAGGTGGGASFSRDGGNYWHKVTQGLAVPYGVTCAADPVQPEIWYVSVAPSPSKAYGSDVEAYLYRHSGGADWQPIGWEPHPMRQMPVALVTDPQAPGHLYAGLTNGDVWYSRDYGDAWQKHPFNLKRIGNSLIIL